MTVQCEVYIKEDGSTLNFIGAELFPDQLYALEFVYTIGRTLKEIFQHELPNGIAYTSDASITASNVLIYCIDHLLV